VRIGVIGVHGVGKTMLAKRLSEELGLPLVEEAARKVIERWGRHPVEFPVVDDGVRYTCESCRNLLDAILREAVLRGKRYVTVRGTVEERCRQAVETLEKWRGASCGQRADAS